MFGRLLAVWYFPVGASQHVVLTFYVVKGGVSSTFKWKKLTDRKHLLK